MRADTPYDEWFAAAAGALAVATGSTLGGLALGGYILVRTLRREMRLARLKADFVSNLSHELKTPLTSIALFTEMLREGKLATPEDREEAYDVLTQESGRLQRIVGRVLRRSSEGLKP